MVPQLYALTLFVSAGLLFLVQPMVGKMILPLLGGTPSVWNTCMVFFQTLLLLGYLYAHTGTTRLPNRRQVPLHLLILSLPVILMIASAILTEKHLPIPVLRDLSPQGSDFPILGVLVLLTVAIAFPFFALSTSAPLLQKWFSTTGHPSAKDPYFLYAASNVGSLLVLVGYPFLIEPNLTVGAQTWLFAGGYLVLVVLTFLCSTHVRPNLPKPSEADSAKKEKYIPADVPSDPAPTLRRKLHWLALAFIPSSLMLACTTYMSTDIASIPLMWVIPLALYLLTFVIAFAKPIPVVRTGLLLLTPMMILLLVFLMNSGLTPRLEVTLVVHLATFFCVALTCHSEMARLRPSTSYLTQFYLLMSVGGMMGGMFNAFVAPTVFKFISEYPLTLIAACIVLPPLAEQKVQKPWSRQLDLFLPFAIFAGASGLLVFVGQILELTNLAALTKHFGLSTPRTASILAYGLPTMVCYLFVDRALRFGLCVAAICFASYIHDCKGDYGEGPLRKGPGVIRLLVASGFNGMAIDPPGDGELKYRERGFFGAMRVSRSVQWREIPPSLVVPSDSENYKLATRIVQIAGTDRNIEQTIAYAKIELMTLAHGTTLHGTENIHALRGSIAEALGCLAATDDLHAACLMLARQEAWQFPGRVPLSYYHRTGPVGWIMHAAEQRRVRNPNTSMDFGFVGLGTGTLACYVKPGRKATFFEIDPAVLRLVEPPTYFTFLSRAREQGAHVEVILGDARVRLEEQRERGDPKFGVLLIDAFSSDAIPTHLLTKEAVQLYFDRLSDDGLLGLHISNRYLRLEEVVARLEQELGVSARLCSDPGDDDVGKTTSSWVVLARKPEHFGPTINRASNWVPLPKFDNPPLWTDNFTNIVRIFGR